MTSSTSLSPESAFRAREAPFIIARVLSSARKATILVVEDDRTLREMYRAALTVAGYAVVAVEDGIDALKCVEQAPPGMIVLDLALPRRSGHDVRRELASRAETRHDRTHILA